MIWTILLITSIVITIGVPVLWFVIWDEIAPHTVLGPITLVLWLVAIGMIIPLIIEINRRGPIADELRAQNYYVVSVDGLGKNVTFQTGDKLVECRVEEIGGKWGIVDSSTCKDIGPAPANKSNELIGPEAFGG